MKNTIKIDLDDQVMRCCVCGEAREIPRRLLRDQHALLEEADELRVDHRECAADPDRPHLAKLSREFRKRLEREQRKTNDRTHESRRIAA